MTSAAASLSTRKCGWPECEQEAHNRCSKCLAIYYCCALHQKNHWKTHKQDCSKLASLKETQVGLKQETKEVFERAIGIGRGTSTDKVKKVYVADQVVVDDEHTSQLNDGCDRSAVVASFSNTAGVLNFQLSPEEVDLIFTQTNGAAAIQQKINLINKDGSQ